MEKKDNEKFTLAELNMHPGDIARQVYYTRKPVIITANRKPLVEIRPVEPKPVKKADSNKVE